MVIMDGIKVYIFFLLPNSVILNFSFEFLCKCETLFERIEKEVVGRSDFFVILA